MLCDEAVDLSRNKGPRMFVDEYDTVYIYICIL